MLKVLFLSAPVFASLPLTLEEKIGQLLIVHFNGTEANEEARRLIEDVHVGGFILYNWANGLETFEQTARLCKSLQDLSPIPLWLCLDQEGGPVARLPGTDFFPGNRRMAQLTISQAEKLAFLGAKKLQSLGINMNLAPVVDVSSQPKTSYMTSRTFGNTPEIVIPYAEAFLKGYKRAGVVSVLKHFPGYGEVSIDPHADLPINNKSFNQLMKTELAPYLALGDQPDVIMTAHILVPALDAEKCATLSKKIITGILRERIGFQGVVISDSLVMQGLLNNGINLENAAIEALLAGCDLLILGGKQILGNQEGFELRIDDYIRIFHALIEAVKTGRLPLERVDEAVQRLINLKHKYK